MRLAISTIIFYLNSFTHSFHLLLTSAKPELNLKQLDSYFADNRK